jgi:hypothetical protein
VRPLRNVFYKLSCTEQRREGVAAYLWYAYKQASVSVCGQVCVQAGGVLTGRVVCGRQERLRESRGLCGQAKECASWQGGVCMGRLGSVRVGKRV